MRVATRCAVGLFVLLSVTACAGGVAGTAAVGTDVTTATGTSTASTQPTQSPPRTSPSSRPATSSTSSGQSSSDITLGSGVTIEELAGDIDSAQQIVDGYWSKHWSDFFTGTYQPPKVVGLYGTNANDFPTCNGVPLDAYNAWYCSSEDYVAWDASLLVDGADVVGDSWVYLVIAHEWGHAVQARLNSSLLATGYELQADCLGAAALFGAVADGTLQLEPGDDQELISSLSLLADDMAWTTSGDHGDPFQRVQWFTLGRNGGANACFDVIEGSSGPVPQTFNDSVQPTAPPTS